MQRKAHFNRNGGRVHGQSPASSCAEGTSFGVPFPAAGARHFIPTTSQPCPASPCFCSRCPPRSSSSWPRTVSCFGTCQWACSARCGCSAAPVSFGQVSACLTIPGTVRLSRQHAPFWPQCAYLGTMFLFCHNAPVSAQCSLFDPGIDRTSTILFSAINWPAGGSWTRSCCNGCSCTCFA